MASRSQPVTEHPASAAATADPEPSAAGSRLFLTYVAPDDRFDGIMRQVWRGTPWIVDAYVGDRCDGRRREMWEWCSERLGVESWPFSENPRPGRWHSGSATVFGWQWWGFDTEAEMQAFAEAFPPPAQQAEASPTPRSTT
jgi:hypothetical protein